MKLIYSKTNPHKLTPKGKAQLREYLSNPHNRALDIRHADLLQADDNRRLLSTELCPIHLDSQLEYEAEQWGYDQLPRKKNWLTPVSVIQRDAHNSIGEDPFEYSGRYKGWTGSNAYTRVQSFGAIDRTGVLHTILQGKRSSYRAGRGYHWAIDGIGFVLVHNRTGEHYHPNTLDLELGGAHLRKKIRSKIENRKALLAEQKRLQSLVKRHHEVWVSLSDSLQAGNCRVGTERYANRHGLDIHQHYPASELPDQSDRQVVAAILQAARRHQADLKRGYCEVTL